MVRIASRSSSSSLSMFLNSRFDTSAARLSISFSKTSSRETSFSSSASEIKDCKSLYLLSSCFHDSIHSLWREISCSIFCEDILSSQKPGAEVCC
jgi:hypothetical protein